MGSTSIDDERTFSAVTQKVEEYVSTRAPEVKATIDRYRFASRGGLRGYGMAMSRIGLERD